MNRLYTFLSYLGARLAEPTTHLALMALFGAAGFTVSDATYHAVLMGLATVTGLLAIGTKEHAAAVASGAPDVISATVMQTLFDFMGQGPAVAAIAKQLYVLHSSGTLGSREMLALLPNLNALVDAAAPTVVVQAPTSPPPAPPAAVVQSASGPIAGIAGAILLAFIGCTGLSACATGPTVTTAKDLLAEADASYQALAAVETVAGNYCASSPTVAPCPSIPFAKIATIDGEIYASLTAANTAAAQSNATSVSIALAAIKDELPQALALIPTSTDPSINAAVAALKIAIETFTTDMGA
jgi:hypothetical protein